MAGYAFALLRFPGRRLLCGAFVSLLFVPGITVLRLLVILQSDLGILGSRIGLIVPFTNGTAPLSIMLGSSASPQDNVLTAASLVIVVPVVILLLLLQRYFINGLAGAVHG